MHKSFFKFFLITLFVFFVFGPWSMVHGPQLAFSASLPDPNYPLGDARLLTRSLAYVQRYYVDPSRIHPDAMFEASLNQVQRTIPEILVKCEKPTFCSVTVDQATKRFKYPQSDLSSLASRLREVLEFMGTYVNKDTDKQEIEFSAIDGLLNELDPHSNFLSPDVYREFRVGTEGEFGGLGIVIGLKDGRLTVTAPLEGTPAWRAGVKAGDRIIQINDESTINMTLTEAVEHLRGPVGTKVTLKIERNGKSEPLIMTLKRAVINIEAVQSKLVKTPQGNEVGFFRVKSFQANTATDFETQLRSMMQNGNKLKGIVLDMRNNRGGLLDQAVNLADDLLKEGTIVSTVGPGGKMMDRKEAAEEELEGPLPIVVLVNEGSASASEIVAGALKNNDRAVIVGSKTFGKGSVQSIYELPLEAALKLTIAQYLTPGDRSIQSIGITPDIELDPIIVDKNRLNILENILMTEKDLEKHLDKSATEQEKSDYKLRFLVPAPKENQEQEYRTDLKIEGDTAAEVALSLMDIFSSSNRHGMLDEAKQAIKERQSVEDKKIAANFQKLGFDWSLGESKETSQAELSFQLLKDGKPIKKAVAGDNVSLQIALRNVGQHPFYRLVAQSDAEEPLFKNMEFAFGKVAPGDSRKWETKIKIPPSALSQEVTLKLKFNEGRDHAPPDAEIIIPIQGLKRPRFAHQYFLEGKPSHLVKGQPIDLTVKVTNEGEGVSKAPVVSLRNLGGKEIFIEKGRVALENLEPGKTQTANLRFHIDSAWEGENFRLELLIADPDLLVISKQDVIFNVADATLSPAAGVLYIPPAITISSKGGNSNKNPFIIQGEVKDDQGVKDIYIYREEEKVFYEANSKDLQTFPFQVPLTLKEGNNILSVTARDKTNLVSRQFLVVHYEALALEEN